MSFRYEANQLKLQKIVLLLCNSVIYNKMSRSPDAFHYICNSFLLIIILPSMKYEEIAVLKKSGNN